MGAHILKHSHVQRTQKRQGERHERDHSGAVTHMHSQATEFPSVCGCLLWENEGGLSLEAGAGDHPQQPPASLIQSVHKPALEPRGQAFLHYHTSIGGGQRFLLAWGRQDILFQRRKLKRVCPGLSP